MKRKEKPLDVPISAMIDVVFLLLVYFVFTAKTPVNEVAASVNLPGPGPVSDVNIPSVEVRVYEDTYIVNGNRYELNEAEKYFMGISGAFDDVIINIKVSKDATHKRVVLLLDRLKKAKLSKFNLHTLK